MGILYQLWDQTYDPDDPVNGYTPYTFVPAGSQSVLNMSLSRDYGRRESVQAIPGMDSVLDGYGRLPGPQDRRDVTFSFRVFAADGDLDKAYDLLAAQVAPGFPQRLVYRTDAGALWFTTGTNPRIQTTLASENNWGHGGFVDFTVSWRIRPDWRARFSNSAQVWMNWPATFSPDNHLRFTAFGSYAITLAAQFVAVDARGTAGLDLATIPDTGPTITVTGPAGGDGGMLLANTTALVRDQNGTVQAEQFVVPFKLVNASDSCVLKLAAQAFTHNGTPFRPSKPSYQTEWLRIVPGVINNFAINAIGANPLVGGVIKIDYWDKRA